jgi:hypothetical protein
MLTLRMVGFNAGLTHLPCPLTTLVLHALLGAVVTLLVDLDQPRDRCHTMNQQLLIDL